LFIATADAANGTTTIPPWYAPLNPTYESMIDVLYDNIFMLNGNSGAQSAVANNYRHMNVVLKMDRAKSKDVHFVPSSTTVAQNMIYTSFWSLSNTGFSSTNSNGAINMKFTDA